MLHKLRAYISLLLLVAITFPKVAKVLHEFEHAHEEHCEATDTHFYQEDHSCSICDIVFSTSSTPIEAAFEMIISQKISAEVIAIVQSNKTTFPNYTFSLRGPPAC